MSRSRHAVLSGGVLCLVIAALLVTTSGCWDRRELDERLHVLSVFLDLEPGGEIRLSVEVLGLGPGTREEQSTHAVISAVGGSFREAAWNMRWQVEAELDFTHTGIVVLGEELARSGITDVIDSMAQSYEVRRRAFVVVSQGKAADLLGAGLTASRHSEQLVGLAEAAGGAGSAGGTTTINEVIRSFSNEGKDVLLARFILQPPSAVKHVAEHAQAQSDMGGGPGGAGETGGEAGAHEEGPPVMALNGAAIFREDGTLSGFLEEREAAALQMSLGSARARTVRIPTDPQSPRKGITLRTSSTSARFNASQEGGRLIMEVRVQIEADIVELETGGDMASTADVAHIEQLVAQHIESLFLYALTYCAGELGSDPAGLGRFLSRWHPDLWDQFKDRWPEALAEAEIRPEVHVSIVNTGMLLRKARGPGQAPPPGGGS